MRAFGSTDTITTSCRSGLVSDHTAPRQEGWGAFRNLLSRRFGSPRLWSHRRQAVVTPSRHANVAAQGPSCDSPVEGMFLMARVGPGLSAVVDPTTDNFTVTVMGPPQVLHADRDVAASAVASNLLDL